jgi:small subunit ribosomal protein S1
LAEFAIRIAAMSSDQSLSEGAVTTETASTVSQPVAASSETPPNQSTPAPVAAEAATSAESEAERSRPRLNPTVSEEQSKAIPSPPSFTGSPAPAPAAMPAEAAEVAAVEEIPEEAPLAQSRASGAVALPPKVSELDAEMEAEIAEALASGEIGAIAPPAAAPAAGQPAAGQLAAGQRVSEDQLEPGVRLKGTVQAVHGDTVIVDVGFRASGYVPIQQFEGKTPEVGAVIDVTVEKYNPADGTLICSLPKATRSVGNWSEVAVGQIVDCMVVKSNKGGLEVSISSLRGFLPAGQVDIGYIANLDTYVGQKLRVKITEVNPAKRNLVVSRRAFLEIGRAEAREELWKTLAVGQTFSGTVKTLKDYGAFIDIGGVDGLLHVGEMSWTRIAHPSDVLKEGQQVEVQVLVVDREKSKISLGMRQLQQNPWGDVEDRFPVNSTVRGKVTKTTDFGAFVELEQGLEGLIHISELDHRRIHRVTDVVQQGQEVEAQVLSIDLERKRIALSLKSLRAKPDAPAKKDDLDLAPGGNVPYERKRKGPLKGGTAGSAGGGLFFGGQQENS